MRRFKNLFFIMLMALMTIVAIGCEKESKIKLSFEEESYSVEIGKEITVEPVVENEENEEYKLVFESRDEAFVTYIDGKVKGIAVGEAKIRVSVEGNDAIFAEVTVKVTPKPTVKVSFNVDGGSEIADITVVKGEAIARPVNPIKEGHVFVGWFTDAEKTQEYDFDSAVNVPMTLYAKWVLANYHVSFDSAGGTAVNKIGVVHGNKIVKPTDPTKEKSRFLGWYTDSAYTQEFDFNTPIVRDITLYAKWELVKFTVTFDVAGGSEVAAQQVVVDEKATKPADPTKDGFIFIGWFKEAEGINEFDFATEVVKANVTIYAVWVDEDDLSEVTLNWNYANKDEEVISFLWDFYTWLDSKGIIDADEMTFAAFSGKDKTGTGVDGKFIGEYIKYIGLTGDALALNNTDYFANSVNHLRLQGARDTAPNTINDSYFFNSTEYNAKWVQYANWIHDETKAHTNRFWDQSVGQYDMMRYITGLNFADGSYVKVDGTANYNMGDFSMTIKYHAYSDATIPTVTLFGKSLMAWNTEPDGSGDTYYELPVGSPVDLVLYAMWEDPDAPLATDKILVDLKLNKAEGETFQFGEERFKVGETAFKTVEEALAVLEEGFTLILRAGTYDKPFAVTVSNVTIMGAGQAVIKNKITLTGANNITITKLEFTGLGQIFATGKFDGFVFDDNKVYNSTIEATAYAPRNRTNVNAFIQLYTGAESNVLGDITITNNVFNGMNSDIIALDRTSEGKTITITDNEFRNFNVGAIRFDGGYNNGTYNILRNIFENDELGGSAAIVFRAYSAEKDKTQVINIEDNKFKNIGNLEDKDPVDTHPASAVITTSTFNDQHAAITIKNNIFENNVNDLHLRNTGALETNWSAKINNNQFIGTKNYIYYETVDLADLNHNYYEDADGNAITDLEVLATLIHTNTNYDELATKPE